jgi:hypothetical protein
MIDLNEKIMGLYEEWLLNNCPENIVNKDDFILKIEQGFRYEEFCEKIKEVLE